MDWNAGCQVNFCHQLDFQQFLRYRNLSKLGARVVFNHNILWLKVGQLCSVAPGFVVQLDNSVGHHGPGAVTELLEFALSLQIERRG